MGWHLKDKRSVSSPRPSMRQATNLRATLQSCPSSCIAKLPGRAPLVACFNMHQRPRQPEGRH
eukprot:14075609-Alexandrium_andersonii.AAC.1